MIRAKQTAQSTVRALNDLVGEATDRIEDVLPKVEALPKKIESVLPGRKKKSHKRRNIGTVLVAGVAAAMAFLALKSRRHASAPAASSTRPATQAANRDTSSVSGFDQQREPAVSRN